MTVTMQWPENAFTKREIYSAVNGSATMIQRLPEGTELDIVKFIIYLDEKENGECAEVLHLVDRDGNHYATISNSIKKMVTGFVDFIEDATETGLTIRTKRGETKAGRTYWTVDIL